MVAVIIEANVHPVRIAVVSTSNMSVYHHNKYPDQHIVKDYDVILSGYFYNDYFNLEPLRYQR